MTVNLSRKELQHQFLEGILILLYLWLLPMFLTERFLYFQCKILFRDFHTYLKKSLSLKIQAKYRNFSMKNIWEQANIHWNKESFQELVLSHLPWQSSSQKVTKFRNYMNWGCIICPNWVWFALLWWRYCKEQFHLPLTGSHHLWPMYKTGGLNGSNIGLELVSIL